MSMLSGKTKKKLERNIRLFGVYKVFTKRAFLPLTTIYAAQQAGLNIQQIGLVASFSSLLSLLCDTPTGYWADTHGRKKSAQIGGFLAACGSLIYVFSTDFTGILSASLVLAIGYSFLIGAMDALVHDSLAALGRVDDFAKAASRAQSLGLVGNAVLVATVPLLYPIDKRLPFVVGFIAYCVLFALASLVTEPNIKHDGEAEEKRFVRNVRMILTRKTLPFFALAGFVFAAGTGSSDLSNLSWLELGLDPKYLGIIFGATSLVGAVIGLGVHHLKKLTFRQYAIFDLCVTALPFIAFGFIRSLPIVIAVFMLNLSLWRYEQIMYQHYVLKIYGSTRYKATIMSMLVNFRSLNEVWIAFAATSAARHFGLLNTMGYCSLVVLAALPLLMLSISKFEASATIKLPSANQ